MIRIVFLAALLAVVQTSSAQMIFLDSTGTITTPGELTKIQLDTIIKKSSERAEVECLNKYTAQAAAAGAIAGNLATRPGSLLRPGPLLGLALIIWLGNSVYDAIVEGRVRAECAAAGAAAGLAVSYWYFQRLYKNPPPATTPLVPGPGAPIPG